MRLEQSIKEFYQFLCQPIFNYKSDNPISFRHINLMFLILFVFQMIIASALFSALGLDESTHKLTELFETTAVWQIFLMAVIIAPFFEEMIFRAYLRWPESLLLLYVGIVGAGFYYMPKSLSIITFVVVSLSLFFFYKIFQNRKDLSQFFINNFGYIFYLSVIIFAYIHIFNFESIKAWYLVPAMVLPQFVLALFLGYVRVRNNIWTCIYVHMINNAIPMTMYIVGSQFMDV